MAGQGYNLAIETSGRQGSIELGDGDKSLGFVRLPAPRRHRVELMPAIAALCDEHGVTPAQLAEVYVSLGPGSFTGLRIGVTTAKMLALAGDVKLIGVPTLDVVAQNVADLDDVLICVNVKGRSVYAQRFSRGEAVGPACVDEIDKLLPAGAVLGDALPAIDANVLDPALAAADARALRRVARRQSQYTEPEQLLPIYARRSDAEQQWDERYGKGATIQSRKAT